MRLAVSCWSVASALWLSGCALGHLGVSGQDAAQEAGNGDSSPSPARQTSPGNSQAVPSGADQTTPGAIGSAGSGGDPAGPGGGATHPAIEHGVPISKVLVGNNVWLDPSDEIWQKSAQAGLQIIRIGGIAYDNNVPSNEKLKNWVGRIKAMGAEPMLQVSQYRSPQDAADLVRYFNVDTGDKVIYWNIGNEPWIERNRPDATALAGTVAGYVKPIAQAMRDVDPTIKIFAPDECDYFEGMYNALLGGDQDITGKDAKGRYYIDGISWHRYVGGDLLAGPIEDFRHRMAKTRSRIDFANQKNGRAGGNALGWGIGEFNADSGGLVHSFENGQLFGTIYGHAMRFGATYVATWSMFENGGSRGGTDFSFIDGPTKAPRASYYHMQMISKYFRGTSLEATSSAAKIMVFASLDQDKLSVMILNLEKDTRKTCTLRLNKNPLAAGDCRLNVNISIQADLSVALNARETRVLLLDGQGRLQKTLVYSATNFSNNTPPVEQ